jgi:hypothetical protein
VEFVHAQRYVVAEHVREHFAERLRSPRSTSRHLQHLVHLGYLNTVGPRTGAPHNIPLVYYATGRGLHFVQQAYAAQGIAWQHGAAEEQRAKGKSLEHVLHEVLLSQFGSDLRLSVEVRPDLHLLWSERRWFRHPLTILGQGTRQCLVPDLGFVLAQDLSDGRRQLRLHFVELDLGGMSLPRWRAKLEAYRQWAESTAGEYLGALARRWGVGPSPLPWRLAIIAHDKLTGRDHARLRDLVLVALELPAGFRSNLWFTTVEALARHAEDQPPLSASCWLWLKDAPRFLARFQRVTTPLARGAGRRTLERRLLDYFLPELPRYALLPPPVASVAREVDAGRTFAP